MSSKPAAPRAMRGGRATHLPTNHPEMTVTHPTAFTLLRDAEAYLSALHVHVARHDNIGVDLTCGGCLLRDRIAAALPTLAEPAADLERARRVAVALEQENAKLTEELAEEKARHNPRLPGLLVKAAPDKDLYVNWSTVCDMPGGLFSRETALAFGFPRSYLDRADATGTSSHGSDGAWDDTGFVAEQRGWLRRDRLGDYAVEYLHGDRQAAFNLLEPFEGETEVRQ